MRARNEKSSNALAWGFPPVTLAFSVVICSWNRVSMLEDTVESLLACSRTADFAVEIIVVDNASSDGTTARMRRYADSGQILLLHEHRPGLSFARNTGVQSATGSWIVFLDDDVLVPTDFLIRYAAAMKQFGSAAFIAGPIRPVFDVAIPSWAEGVLETFPWCFSALDMGQTARPLKSEEFPYGANMAIRMDVARRFKFATELGFKHGTLVGGEETDLFRTVVAAGYSGVWIGDIPVQHRLPPDRARAEFLIRRAKGQGLTHALIGKDSPLSWQWLLFKLTRLTLALPFLIAFQRRRAGPAVISCAYYWGYILGQLRGERA